uniref:Uncharacterized protein n=1 Tax=uncultured prokaryote TaxID=198431 RepID=A0A0H5Q122_9ZZZZ|nr:hypothetical protein [uncultured prokaryote]
MNTKKTKASGRVTKSADTWTVRGVSPETRAAVKVAARKAGKPIGEWLESTLSKAAIEQASHAHVPAPRIEDALAKIVERLEAIEGRKQPQGFWARLFGR